MSGILHLESGDDLDRAHAACHSLALHGSGHRQASTGLSGGRRTMHGPATGFSFAHVALRVHAAKMFCVDDATAESIRRAFMEHGDMSAVVEFRRHFPLITDHARALECARIIAGWGSTRPPAEVRENVVDLGDDVVPRKPRRLARRP